ncbi:MFS transporter [Nevskia soli]|uniref:MFS transporter n=1 Tax=Nevskia soli TaxID=418856 RepID=UPI0004A6ED1B|nr:MFS transporter [Nevskia soli]
MSAIHNDTAGSAPGGLEHGTGTARHEPGKVSPGEIAIGVIIGRVSEFFDFFVFGIASVIVFPAVFFPFVSPLTGTLYSFTVFSFAFIARPIGSLLFRIIHQRYGRGTKLTIALFMLGTATAGIAFLPGYADIGETAIILLSLLRIGQGLAVGGSWDGLPSLLALNAPQGRRGWYAMIPQLGAPIGFVIAAGLFVFLISNLVPEDFNSWGWRYPFYVAFAINVVALFARLRLVATPEFAQLLKTRELEPAPLRELVREHGTNVVLGSIAPLASYALFHLVTIFPLSWIILFTQQSVGDVLLVQIIGAAIAVPCMVMSGAIADRYGRRKALGIFAILIAIYSGWTPVLLSGSTTGGYLFILLGFALLGFSHGQSAGAVNSSFGSRYRYSGAVFTSDLSWLTGAAFAPLVALELASHFGVGYVGLYLLSGALATLLALRINQTMDARDD